VPGASSSTASRLVLVAFGQTRERQRRAVHGDPPVPNVLRRKGFGCPAAIAAPLVAAQKGGARDERPGEDIRQAIRSAPLLAVGPPHPGWLPHRRILSGENPLHGCGRPGRRPASGTSWIHGDGRDQAVVSCGACSLQLSSSFIIEDRTQLTDGESSAVPRSNYCDVYIGDLCLLVLGCRSSDAQVDQSSSQVHPYWRFRIQGSRASKESEKRNCRMLNLLKRIWMPCWNR
jgi:hypothetical protein